MPNGSLVPDSVHKIRVPLTGSPLGWVNCYVLQTDEGYALVDCGWDMPDALEALRKGLDERGIKLEDIRRLILTHNHPDHYGLAGRLVQLAACGVVMHRLDAVHIESRYVNMGSLQSEMHEWLRIHGAPSSEIVDMVKGSEGILSRVNIVNPDIQVAGGERITGGKLEWEIIWTPGHSVGHICLYERTTKSFLSGDHILNPISPSIGLHAQSMGNPLSDYLGSLEAIRERDVDVVLPAHGDEFRGFLERIDELMSHHEARLGEICEIIQRHGSQTAYGTASFMRWRANNPWENWPPFQRRMATTEALAHTELLVSRGRLRRVTSEGGIVRYALSKEHESN